MIPPGVRAIFFDAVGTLIVPDPPAAVVYHAVGRKHGSRLSLETIQTRFRRAFLREEEEDFRVALRTDESREERRWQRIVREVLDDVADPAACFGALFEHFARPDGWRCVNGIGPVFAALRERDYLLGLASNFDQRLRAVAAAMPELAPASRIVISSEIGWRKPARQFFDCVVAQAGVPAEQVLFVGDDRVNDDEGAHAAGLQSLLLDRNIGAGTIQRLEQLLETRDHP